MFYMMKNDLYDVKMFHMMKNACWGWGGGIPLGEFDLGVGTFNRASPVVDCFYTENAWPG